MARARRQTRGIRRLRGGYVWLILIGMLFPAVHADGSDTVLSDSISLDIPSLYENLDHPADRSVLTGPTVALALSGGGARALAQIGVLRALEESGIRLAGIAGTSMGAIVGGLYAAGYSARQIDSLVHAVDAGTFFSDTPPRTHLLLPQKDIRARSFLTLHFRGLKPNLPAAVTGGQRLTRLLTELCHAADYHAGANFDSLVVPFRAVATDLITGRMVNLRSGDLALSLRAASAFPLALTPARTASMILVDGGLTNPVPVDIATAFGADLVIAVNTASQLAAPEDLQDLYGVASQSTTIMTAQRLQRSLAQADLVITPPLDLIDNFDFAQADSIIASGYFTARRVLDSLLSTGWADRDHLDWADTLWIDSVVIANQPDTGLTTFIDNLLDSQRHTITELKKQLQQLVNTGDFYQITIETSRRDGISLAEVRLSANPLLSGVRFSGNTVFPDSLLLTRFAALLGARANNHQIAAAARECLQMYINRAYSLAEIRRIELDTLTGELSLEFDEGRVSGLKVSGNRTVKNWVITRNFPLKRGRPFNYRIFLRGLEDLHASGLFSQINGRIIRTVDGPAVLLEVREKDYDIVRFGLRHNLEYQTDGFVEIVNSNILGVGNEIYFHVGYCPRRERYATGLRADRIFRTYLTADIRAYREIHERYRYTNNNQTGRFETTREGFLLSFGQNIKRLGTISGGFRAEDIKLTSQPDAGRRLTRLRSISLTARYDDLDRLPFPRNGRRFTASAEWADDFAGGGGRSSSARVAPVWKTGFRLLNGSLWVSESFWVPPIVVCRFMNSSRWGGGLRCSVYMMMNSSVTRLCWAIWTCVGDFSRAVI